MSLANITKVGEVLHVEHDGYYHKRIDGVWFMLSRDGNWFENEPYDRMIKNQITDYENCLRSYTIEEGPAYPTNRKFPVDQFFRDLQQKELYAAGKGIFAKVNVGPYNANAETKKRLSIHIRSLSKAYTPSMRAKMFGTK